MFLTTLNAHSLMRITEISVLNRELTYFVITSKELKRKRILTSKGLGSRKEGSNFRNLKTALFQHSN